MKVVLFCGGFGTRLREYSEEIPKPMVPIGYRPILWHLMKYYAHYGHKDFVVCLGYKADVIKEYFLNYDEWLSNDFVLRGGGREVDMLATDIDDWTITFVDTGMRTNIGGRLMAVREHLESEDVFLANYSDNLTDLVLPEMIGDFQARDAVASFLCVKPSQSFHLVDMNGDGQVESIRDVTQSEMRINGGYFVLRREIFDYMQPGDELVLEPFQRLIEQKKLYGYQHDGFWGCMDTFKEKQKFDELYARGHAPWQVWKNDER